MTRNLLLAITLSAAILAIASCEGSSEDGQSRSQNAASVADATATTNGEDTSMAYEVNKSDEEWREILTPEQYHVTREAGTERAFTGKYWDHKVDGTYTCVCCGAKLFESDSKFDSGCGWPSFDKPLPGANIQEREDNSFGMRRIEVICPNCGAHLGHVFDDGPTQTGLRYCINSASLEFKPEEKEK